jgi:CubicO group peptidase (beta-lactamase class C family)/D-alanyl-D-alanine dipeptidase
MTRTVLTAAFLLGLSNTSFGQAKIEPPDAYKALVDAFRPIVESERAAKRLPAVSVALVADGQIVYADGFGFADPRAKTPATAETVYRVGSVSKLFTDLAIMQLVEAGKLDLDKPVSDYLSGFQPRNPFPKPITLRQMMCHRSGLVRESPVGHYFDATSPTLAATVDSLNDTTLVYPPEAHTKYSNAAIATVGYVLEKLEGEPFAQIAQRRLLQPLGMSRSGFQITPELSVQLAKAVMWTTDGREFPAPGFALGTIPAGNLYSTALDLGGFLKMLLSKGQGPAGRIIKSDTLAIMYTPQCVAQGEDGPFGIGFALAELDGHRRVGHGGAVYGFATEVAALPEDGLGVVVIASRDCANGSTRFLADTALRLLLAGQEGKSIPEIRPTTPIPPEQSLLAEGRYVNGDKAITLFAQADHLYMQPPEGARAELRVTASGWITDDALSTRTPVVLKDAILTIKDTPYHREPEKVPTEDNGHWAPLIGEYGWDHNVLYILERKGKLHALIEWFFLYPLEEVGPDVFAFPHSGLYDGEELLFLRDENNRVDRVVAASVVFPRRPIDGENGKTFRIKPVRPVEELRAATLDAMPPKESGDFRPIDLVDVSSIDPTIKLDIRYATANNFLGTPVYRTARAFAQRPVVEALGRVNASLKSLGYGLLIHDAYRPWHITKLFWDATPEISHNFVADPSKGSKHNRGAAIDLSLYDLKSGEPVVMVGGYDEFSDRSNPYYPGGTSRQRALRNLLRKVMEAQSFHVNEYEWWHFDHEDWAKYPIGNVSFETLDDPARR